MNNKKLQLKQKFAKVIVIAGIFASGQLYASAALDAINASVEQQANKIDQQYGVLLTAAERSNLKMALIVKAIGEQNDLSATDLSQLTDDAAATYGITDPVQQRQLLIELEAQKSNGGGSGYKPACC